MWKCKEFVNGQEWRMVLKQTLLKKINSEKKYMLILKVKKYVEKYKKLHHQNIMT